MLDAMEGVEAAEAERATRRDALTKEQARVAEELKARKSAPAGWAAVECKGGAHRFGREIDAV